MCHDLRDVGVAGSNPVTPTTDFKGTIIEPDRAPPHYLWGRLHEDVLGPRPYADIMLVFDNMSDQNQRRSFRLVRSATPAADPALAICPTFAQSTCSFLMTCLKWAVAMC